MLSPLLKRKKQQQQNPVKRSFHSMRERAFEIKISLRRYTTHSKVEIF